MNSTMYASFGALNIPGPFLSVECPQDWLRGEISGEAHLAAHLAQERALFFGMRPSNVAVARRHWTT
jgi:hypothetical protein